MPTVIRFNEKRYLSSGVNLTELFDQLPEPIAYFDPDNRLGACNLSFRDAFPVVIESEFLKRAGAGPAASAGPSSAGSSSVSYDALSQRARAELADARNSIAQDLPRPISTRTRDFQPEVIRTRDGGTLLTFRDLSALRRMEEEYVSRIEALNAELAAAQRATQKALSVARARKDFLASTSHELRTPLNAILGFSEMITKEMFGPLQNDRYLDYAKIIHSSGVHVLSLINDLLDLSKLDAGKMELRVERVEILKIIIDCVRCVETQAASAHVGISIRVCDGIDLLMGDDKRIHQMLLNLLSNALKFTPVGGEVSIDVFRRGADIAISVSDTGIGIKTEDIPRVLEPFGQVQSALGQNHQGTGLGLPLTKELAELHGGSLTMESSVNVGTTVTITLPPDPKSAA